MTQINYQKLLDLAAMCDALPPERFTMKHIMCGSVGCIAGHGQLAGIVSLHSKCFVSDLSPQLGITKAEASWLFGAYTYDVWLYLGSNPLGLARMPHSVVNFRRQVKTPAEAAAKLRKFVYYKLHKAEMCYEEARRIDGNKAAVRAARAAVTV